MILKYLSARNDPSVGDIQLCRFYFAFRRSVECASKSTKTTTTLDSHERLAVLGRNLMKILFGGAEVFARPTESRVAVTRGGKMPLSHTCLHKLSFFPHPPASPLLGVASDMQSSRLHRKWALGSNRAHPSDPDAIKDDVKLRYENLEMSRFCESAPGSRKLGGHE